jgi:hypothetical protein
MSRFCKVNTPELGRAADRSGVGLSRRYQHLKENGTLQADVVAVYPPFSFR